MRIKRLELKNFRGFEELTIHFPEDSNVAVFVGVNGAGKTSVLEAISNLLEIFILRVTQRRSLIPNAGRLKLEDIKLGSKRIEQALFFEYMKIDLEELSSFNTMGFADLSFSPEYSSIINEKLEQARKLFFEDKGTPIVCQYSTDRIILGKPELKPFNIDKIKKEDAYNLSLTPVTSFKDFFNWFRSIEDYENEQRLYKNQNFRDKGLESVRTVIKNFLKGFSNPRVQRQPQEELIVEKNGEKLSISNLSHGERLMFAMVGDIARRLSIANPGLEDPLQGEGVVLIDEIELHLHPGWQRKIVPLLTKTFPNIQFILTTHSPVVLSTVKRENIFILEDFKLVEKTPHTYGRDINSILYQTFGVEERQPEVENDFRKLYALIDDPERVEEAKATLEKMKEKYGADDPELIRADMHLEFLTN